MALTRRYRTLGCALLFSTVVVALLAPFGAAAASDAVILTPVAGDGLVDLAWTAAPGAAGYDVKRSNTGGRGYVVVAKGVKDLAFRDTGLANGTVYYYVVTALGEAGVIGDSNEAAATPENPKVNLLLRKPVTCSSSEKADRVQSLAVDGDKSTRWSSAYSDDQWLKVDLEGRRSIGTIVLRWESAYALAYEILASNDGIAWTTVYRQQNGKGQVEVCTLDRQVNARYLMFHGTTRASVYGFSLWEMEAYTLIAAIDPMILLNLPPAPRITTAIAGNRQAYLSWSKVAGAAGYKIKRSTSQAGPYATIRTGVKSLCYWDWPLENGITYYYVVASENATGVSDSYAAAVTPRDLATRDLEYPPDGRGERGYLGMSLPGWWRPFSADSPWNTPIGDKPAVHPNSDAIIETIASWREYVKVSNDTWSYPIHVVDSDRLPWVSIKSDKIFDAWDTDFNGYADVFAPIPPEAWPEQTTDGHLIVVDPFKKLAWECSRFRRLNDGEPACTTFNIWDLTGTGCGVPLQGERWNMRGGRGSGLPEIAGLVRPEEIEAGEIRHALVFANQKNRQGDKGKAWFVSPASRSDAQYQGEQYPLEGARFQLDPTLTEADFDRMGLGRAAKVMARALQKYGMYLGDNGGNFTIYLQVLDPNPERSKALWNQRCPGIYEDMQKIATRLFRVLDYGEIHKQP